MTAHDMDIIKVMIGWDIGVVVGMLFICIGLILWR